MSTGHEEMRLAAKAAGLRLVQFQLDGLDGQPYGARVFDTNNERRGPFIWNPRHRGDHAIELARKLALCISFWPRHEPPDVMVGWSGHDRRGGNVLVPYGEDPDAATREAIFQAAVNIGRAMP